MINKADLGILTRKRRHWLRVVQDALRPGALKATLLAAVLLTGFCGCSKEESSKTPLELGAIFSLTGNAAAYGKRAQAGIDLAVAEVNERGGVNGRPLIIIYEDDQGNPATAVGAINKLISVNKVPAILGPQISGSALAVAPIAQERRTVLLLPGANTPVLDDAGAFIFRNMPSSTVDGRKAAEVIRKDLKHDRVVVTYPTNAGSTGIARAFITHFQDLGGTVTEQFPYDPKETNFRTIAERIARSEVAIVYAPGYSNDVGLLVRQAREAGVEARFFGAPAMQAPQFLDTAGPASEGCLFTNVAFNPASEDEHVQAFVSSYRERQGVEPDVFAAMAYDAAHLLVDAITHAGYSSDAIRRHLDDIDAFPGVSGITSFDARGNVEKEVMVFVVREGRFVPWTSPR